MTDVQWAYDEYQFLGREGTAQVPGGLLRYRLAGVPDGDVVVIENGWSASFPYAVWLEEALSPHVRVLSYDRAGVGDSRALAPLTAQGLTQQFTALLSHLGIERPVVIAGHSYGGLIAVLHAAQATPQVRAVVQIDPTPEFSHELIDPSYRILPRVGRFMQLCALLRINGPIFLHAARELPAEIFARMRRDPAWLAQSLGGSIEEIRLLEAIRAIVATSESATQCPRLVISSEPGKTPESWLRKLLMNDAKAQRYWGAVHALHQRQASLSKASHWMTVQDNHVSLVTHRATAHRIAASIRDFAQLQEKQ